MTERDPTYGWVMVGATFLLSGLAFGVVGSISVFLKPLAAEFGWSRSATAAGYTTVACSAAVFGMLWGWIADRHGSRWFGFIGATALGICLLLLSRQSSLFHFYALYFAIGAFGMSPLSAPLYASVGFWFRHRPGFALGITAAGGALGQGIVPFAASAIIEAYDWQTAYRWMALTYLALMLPTAMLIREAPGRTSSAGTEAAAVPGRPAAIGDREVITWIAVAVVFCCNCMAVPIVHLVSLLTDAGKDPAVAASVLLVLMVSGGFGRVLGGKLGDMIGALPAYLTMAIGQTVTVYWFVVFSDLWSLYALAVLFGVTYSGVMSSILMATRMMVSPSLGARAMAATSFFGWLGMGMGGFLGGVLFDLTGNYTMSFAVAAAMGSVNVLILIAFYTRTVRAGRAEALA